MTITANASNVLISGDGATLADLTGFTSHFKTIDNGLTFLSSSTALATNGSLIMDPKSGPLVINSSRTFHFGQFKLNYANYTDIDLNDLPTAYADVRGCKIVSTMNAPFSEAFVPVISDKYTMFVFKGRGCCWNSVCPTTRVDGSHFVYESTADGHLTAHREAMVRNVTMESRMTTGMSTLALIPAVKEDGSPMTLPGFRFFNKDGAGTFGLFSWERPHPSGAINPGFDVRPDYCFDVKPEGTKVDYIQRSHRRARATHNATTNNLIEYYGKAVSPTLVYLWLDPYTTLDDQGNVTDTKTYINKVKYEGGIATTDTHNAFDIIGFRWRPKFVAWHGKLLDYATAIVVNNTDKLVATEIGSATHISSGKVASYGIVNDGYFNNNSFIARHKETPETIYKNFQDYSFAYINPAVSVPHLYNEPKVKIIPVFNSAGSKGFDNTSIINGESYTRPQLYVRAKGHIFLKRDMELNGVESNQFRMNGPIFEEIQLLEDSNYTLDYAESDIDLISVNVSLNTTDGTAKTKCIVNLEDGEITLDAIYNKIIDSYVDLLVDGHELPIVQNNTGVLELTDNVELISKPNTVLVAGSKIKHISTKQAINFKTKGIGVVHSELGNMVNFHSKEDMNFLAHVYKKVDGQLVFVKEEYQPNVRTATVGVPTNGLVKISCWSLGRAAFYNEFTVNNPFDYDIQWVDYSNGILNLEIDVEETLNECEVTLDQSGITLWLPAGVYTEAYSKMLLHFIVGTKQGLTATINGGTTISSRITDDRFFIYLPVFRLMKKSNLTASDVCATELYIDYDKARNITPSYTVNPAGDNGRVEIPLRPAVVSPEDIADRTIRDLLAHPQFVTVNNLNMLGSATK